MAHVEMQVHVSLYLLMQISFEVVLEIHFGPVDQCEVVFLLKLIEVENVVGFRTVEIKITCTNRAFVKCASLSTYVLVYIDKTALLWYKRLFLNKRGVSFF